MLNTSTSSVASSVISSTQSSIDALHTCGSVFFNGALEQMGWLFYLISPNSSAFSSPHDVPNYEVQIFPAFTLLLAIEQAVRFFQRKRASRATDIIINLGAGLLFVVARVLLLGTVLNIFYFLYDNYRVIELPPTCISTWILSLLMIEFVYYWVHRSLHEINIFWASHQFHHNAVDIDVSTTLRDTIVDLIIYEFFPVPLALIIPPPILLVHMQFSLIYQVWLHTEVVTHLGPLEYIINTPRQHRVHHGKNRYCIDKNYGALLMVWDRLFGTYQAEEEKITFGTTTEPYKTYDTTTLHFYYYYETVWQKFKQMDGFTNKLKALFYGPGWAPGKPRTGLLTDIPEVDPHTPLERYDPYIPLWQIFYCMTHGFLISVGFYVVTDHPLIRFSHFNALIIFFYVLLALTSFGCIFDRRSIAPLVESARCLLFFLFDSYVISSWMDSSLSQHLRGLTESVLTVIRIFHLLSIVLWLMVWLNRTNSRCKENFDKMSLMKEDKYIDNHHKNRTSFGRLVCYILAMIGSFIGFWAVFALSWSYGAGIQIDEYGDDLYKLNSDKNSRLLILANHQSTADVPLMMQSFESRSSRILLWIMDVAFKYTNFGVVSITHGDYFLNTKGYKPGDILTHVKQPNNMFKDTIVLFPEGGFRFKRIQSSNKYALKNNYPPLNYLTYPRFGAYTELMEPSVGITHVVDLTIAYEDIQNPLTIVDIGCGNRKSKVLFNYKVFSVKDNHNIRSNEWLNDLWKQKEDFLLKYYTDRQTLEKDLTLFNTVSLNWFKVFAIHLFYLSFCLALYLSYKLIKF